MDTKRLRVGDWLTGAAGAAVLASLWLDWFQVDVGVSAWDAFAVTDVVLALAGILGIGMLVLAATNDSPAKPVAAGVLTLAFSAIGVLLVLYRVALNEPGPNAVVGIEKGGYVGALLAIGLFAAALDAVRDESSPHQAPIVPEQLPAPPA